MSSLSALSAVNHYAATQAIANAGKRALKSFALMSRLARFPPKTDTLQHNLDGQKGSLHVESSSTSDKRDDVFARALRLGGCPVCHPASWPFDPGCLRRVPGGVVFRKLSKLLNQEDA